MEGEEPPPEGAWQEATDRRIARGARSLMPLGSAFAAGDLAGVTRVPLALEIRPLLVIRALEGRAVREVESLLDADRDVLAERPARHVLVDGELEGAHRLLLRRERLEVGVEPQAVERELGVGIEPAELD